MKKILLAAGILTSVSFTAFAQNAHEDPRKDAIVQTEQLAKELNLSEEQKKAVLQVNVNMAERRKGREVSSNELVQQQKETEARFRVILSKEQFAKYEQLTTAKAKAKN